MSDIEVNGFLPPACLDDDQLTMDQRAFDLWGVPTRETARRSPRSRPGFSSLSARGAELGAGAGALRFSPRCRADLALAGGCGGARPRARHRRRRARGRPPAGDWHSRLRGSTRELRRPLRGVRRARALHLSVRRASRRRLLVVRYQLSLQPRRRHRPWLCAGRHYLHARLPPQRHREPGPWA